MRSTLISSVCTAVLLVCASVRADLSTPVTPLQFKASYTLSESASIGATNAIGDIGNLATTALAASNDALTSALGGLFGGAGITIGGGANINGGPSKLHGRSVSDLSFGLTVTGTVFYDYINRRMRTDTNVGSSTQTELLLFDLNKNYTWFGNSGCTCGQIEEEYTDMPIYFVPPESPSTFAQADITVNGQNVNAKLYAATIDLPAIGSVVQQFYVNNLNQLIRQKSEVSIAGLASVSTQVDFYNIVGLPSDTSFAPLASCRCASDIPVAGSTFTNTFASTCNAPAEACKCPATVQADITFCRDIVTYPIQSTVFAASVDTFVSTTYNGNIALMSNPSDTCKTSLKDFLCHFYFPQCSADNLNKPVKPNFAASCGASNAEAAAQLSAVGTYDAQSDTYTAGNTNAAGTVLAQAATVLTVAASALLL